MPAPRIVPCKRCGARVLALPHRYSGAFVYVEPDPNGSGDVRLVGSRAEIVSAEVARSEWTAGFDVFVRHVCGPHIGAGVAA